MAKRERRQYNRQMQDYCNDFCDKRQKCAENVIAKSSKRRTIAVYNNNVKITELLERTKKTSKKPRAEKNTHDFLTHGIVSAALDRKP